MVILQANGMSEQSPRQYLAMLERSGLVLRPRLQEAATDLTQRHGAAITLDHVAEYFVQANIITAWHDEKLRVGKYKGFFLGKYKLLGFLGSGGMCSVYLAEHTMLRQPRAIKVLPKSRVDDSSYLDRFYKEGRAAAALSHPNIVRVYDIDHEGDNHYLVMEYVEGLNLYDLVKKKGPLNYREATDYIFQAAIGLQHAHDVKLVHRDVKPANLLVTSGDIVKVLDLGLALFREDECSVTMAHNERVLGTADYLAPEQAVNSHEVDHRADIYGLGCSLYYLLTGKPPFPEGTLAQRIAMHQMKEPRPIDEFRPDCPRSLLQACQTMMRKDRRLRFQDCREVAKQLRAIQDEMASQLATSTIMANREFPAGETVGRNATKTVPVGAAAAKGQKSDSNKIIASTAAAAAKAPLEARATNSTRAVRTSNVAVIDASGNTPARRTQANAAVATSPAKTAFANGVNGSAHKSHAAVSEELADLLALPAAQIQKRKKEQYQKQKYIIMGMVAAVLMMLGLAVYVAITLNTPAAEPPTKTAQLFSATESIELST